MPKLKLFWDNLTPETQFEIRNQLKAEFLQEINEAAENGANIEEVEQQVIDEHLRLNDRGFLVEV